MCKFKAGFQIFTSCNLPAGSAKHIKKKTTKITQLPFFGRTKSYVPKELAIRY